MNRSDQLILQKLQTIPEEFRQEVLDFIEFLSQKYKNNPQQNPPVFGSLKGTFEILPGFDDPLEDVKDYQ
jgi:hypothetical protein